MIAKRKKNLCHLFLFWTQIDQKFFLHTTFFQMWYQYIFSGDFCSNFPFLQLTPVFQMIHFSFEIKCMPPAKYEKSCQVTLFLLVSHGTQLWSTNTFVVWAVIIHTYMWAIVTKVVSCSVLLVSCFKATCFVVKFRAT